MVGFIFGLRKTTCGGAAGDGLTPLEYMLAVMRDPNEPPERRDEMAKAAAPYVHPKLGAYATGGLGRAHKEQPRLERL